MRLMIQLGVFALRVCSTRADRVNNFDEIRIARRTCVDCKVRQKHELTSYRVQFKFFELHGAGLSIVTDNGSCFLTFADY